MTAPAAGPTNEALRLHVTGVVQGVGFRPFVHRLAVRCGLAGWVRNRAGEVEIVLEGSAAGLAIFREALVQDAPPLSRISTVVAELRQPEGCHGFAILDSADEPDRRQPVSPDAALCPACETELFDPANRRYRYPFITCTDCGPRFTVIESMPYDRERTSMRAFSQCPACLLEYQAPGDRRFHSETNSCPECGPRLWFVWVDAAAGAHTLVNPGRLGKADRPDHPTALPSNRPTVQPSYRPPALPPYRPSPLTAAGSALWAAASALRAGRIVAIRGLGGFHLAVDATSEAAVARLRERKRREAKPLAVMVRSLADAGRLAEISEAEADLLRSHERPIVLLRPLRDTPLAAAVAPGLDSVGVMLAYTPLHHLLLDLVGRPLVMTSGNRSEEPIAISNADAVRRLNGIAEAFLFHDREIVARYDDSVVRVAAGNPVVLRRARGYAPLPLDLPVATPTALVAVGPHLKNTFTLAHGHTAYVSQHVGDLENVETLEHFEQSLDAYRRLFRVAPRVAVRDLHPGYLSTRIAEELGLDRVVTVQHHYAHVAAVMAEHGLTGKVVGVAYDGTGYGDDGHVWGAEIFLADLHGYRRMAHLDYAPLPGGDLAARQPWRVALGYLDLEPAAEAAFRLAFHGVPQAEMALADQQVGRKLNAPFASSMGRLFDAAAAVLGVRRVCHYEGQAAMELEALAGTRNTNPLPFPAFAGPDGGWVLDPIPLLAALGERRAGGIGVEVLAAQFHDSVAAATAVVAADVADAGGVDTVALGGGVFQNARLLTSVRVRLEWRGLTVLCTRRLPPNDGAVSYGQAAVAAARLAIGA